MQAKKSSLQLLCEMAMQKTRFGQNVVLLINRHVCLVISSFKNILFPTFTQQRPTFANCIIYKPIVLQKPSHKPKPFCTIVNIHHENKSYTSSIYYMILCILIQTHYVIQD